MADPRGFIRLRRAAPKRQPVDQRVTHYHEFYEPLREQELMDQASRCMECGVPFCQSDTGCPVRNVIPEWNELAGRGRWSEASEILHSTNNFPEFTGRLCPAPCESACVLGLIDDPVVIRTIEQSIADRAFANGWVRPRPPERETGYRIAIVGSGPAGLAAAQQLRRVGHAVTVFEKSDRLGGLLRYGIPDFKLEKGVLDRRLLQLVAEGVDFRTRMNVGTHPTAAEVRRDFDAVLLAGGAARAGDLDVPGRELAGIHFAMDFLMAQNRRVAGDGDASPELTAAGKRVVIIGGGDTGADCAGVCARQGARSIVQFDLHPMPPATRAESTPWPLWPMQLRSSHAHEEGCEREWSMATRAFLGERGAVTALSAVRVDSVIRRDGKHEFAPVPGSDVIVDADLILLAVGFRVDSTTPLVRDLGIACDENGTIRTDAAHRTTVESVYAAGDQRRGASLIVWAIREGRDAAAAIHADLTAAHT